MKKIENVTISTSIEYFSDSEDTSYHSKSKDVLVLKIPLPGGLAKYSIDLPKGMKENIEFAAELSKKV